MTTSIPSQGVGSLSTLLKRLEAATSRLEDIALAQSPGPHLPSGASALHGLASTPALVHTPTTPAGGGGTGEGAGKDAKVEAFEGLCIGPLGNFVRLSDSIGGLVAQQVSPPPFLPPFLALTLHQKFKASHVSTAFLAQKSFVELASACTLLANTSTAFSTLLGPTQKALLLVVEVKEKNRSAREVSNQLNLVAEGIPALGWVTLVRREGFTLSPPPFVVGFEERREANTVHRIINLVRLLGI